MRERERVHVRGRGRVSCEGEREGEIPVLMIVGPRGQIIRTRNSMSGLSGPTAGVSGQGVTEI